EQIVVRIHHGRIRTRPAEFVRAGTTAAMAHTWDHEKTIEIARLRIAAHGPLNGFVTVNRVQRKYRRVEPTLITNNLSTVIFEWLEIRFRNIKIRKRLLESGYSIGNA